MTRNKKNNKKRSAQQGANSGNTTAGTKQSMDREHVLISQGAHDYARAVADPFEAQPCGIPSYPSLPSLKIKTWSKGTFQTGSAGFGFIVSDPRAGAVNDVGQAIFSTSLFAGTSVSNSATVGVSTASSNSPYASTDIGDAAAGVAFRVVAHGLRIRYIGTELNRGGYKIGLVDPTNSTLVGRGVPGFEAETVSRRFAVDRKWTSVTYKPVYLGQTQFNSDLGGGAGAVPVPATVAAGSRQFWLGFAVQAASAGTSLAYEFEVFTIVEFQGSISTGQTLTMFDPVGHAAVDAVMSNSKALIPSQMSSAEKVSTTLQQVSHYVKHGISSYQAASQIAHDVSKHVVGSTSSSSGSWWKTALNWVEALAPALALL